MHVQVLYDALKFSPTQLWVYGESATRKEGTCSHTWGSGRGCQGALVAARVLSWVRKGDRRGCGQGLAATH